MQRRTRSTPHTPGRLWTPKNTEPSTSGAPRYVQGDPSSRGEALASAGPRLATSAFIGSRARTRAARKVARAVIARPADGGSHLRTRSIREPTKVTYSAAFSEFVRFSSFPRAELVAADSALGSYFDYFFIESESPQTGDSTIAATGFHMQWITEGNPKPS